MRRQLFSASAGKHYRRGAVMGLTVAEAFMLVAFVLLLLLLFWRNQVQDAVDLAAKLPPESQQALLKGAVPIQPERLAELERKERQLADTARRVLAEDEVPVTRKRLTELENKERRLDDPARRVLAKNEVPVLRERLKALEETERLLEKPLGRSLAEAAAKLPPETLRKLTDLAREPNTVAAADALSKGAVPIRPERLAELERKERELADTARRVLAEDEVPVTRKRLTELENKERRLDDPARRELTEGEVPVPRERLAELKDKERRLDDPARRELTEGEVPVPRERLEELKDKERLTAGRNAAEIADALELRDALDPYGEDSNKALLDRIGKLQAKEKAVDSRRAEEAQARQKFMDKLRGELSGVVRRAGGKIGPRGRITFPDKAFFEKGSAEIIGRSRTFLNEICSRWLATLKLSPDRFSIDEIRIEGHSSSEWARARSKRDAWVGNLDLSQRRAQSVLVHCLNRLGATPLGDWARGKLTAVGYSSSRLVKAQDGSEDKEASRRIELGYEVSREGPISDLGGAAGAERSEIGPISGNALVSDADTIKIGKTAIRLDGIDAPERNQTCIGDDEAEWPCGREAGSALERRIGGRPVICERLIPGLKRLRGRCRVAGESEELNRWVVQAGWAFAYVKFSKDYARDEAAARKARRGIWSGRAPVPPWEWRGKRAAAAIR